MSGAMIKNWMERWDIAQMLQSKLDISAWKGDEHTNGVFFDDKHGIVLNKVLAIRIKHDESGVSDLFYSFNALTPDGSAEIMDNFPFRGMRVRPKKHFLLFDQEEVQPQDLSQFFETEYDQGCIKVNPHSMMDILDRVSNKRDRERSMAILRVDGDKMDVSIQKSQPRGKKSVLAKGTVDCEVICSSESDETISGAVNAHTLSYLLGIFNPIPFSYVTFSFRRDRILITGEKSDQNPNVEVVVSRLKIA